MALVGDAETEPNSYSNENIIKWKGPGVDRISYFIIYKIIHSVRLLLFFASTFTTKQNHLLLQSMVLAR